VPLQGAEATTDAVHVAVRRDQVKDAPHVDADGQLSGVEEQRLYEHYGLGPQRQATHDVLDGGGQRTTGQRMSGQRTTGQQMTGQAGTDADRPDTEVIRSEERLRVGTETVENGRVRLHKYVVTEDQQVSVPLRHEEIRIEREPISEPGPGTVREEDHEVTLHAERPVVDTETVAVERINVGTDVVSDDETVRGRIRKEQVDIDQDPRR
jgi:uncharacterized protein (TIGR02271 family)